MAGTVKRRVWLGVFSLMGLFLMTSSANADYQASVRYGFGFGSTAGEPGSGFLFESTLRSELLFGGQGDEYVRFGPAVDLRTMNFDTFEAAGGVALSLPLSRGFPLVITAGAGYAWRAEPNLDGAFLVGTLAFGYRGYNFHSPYGLALQLYVSSRVHLDQPGYFELTAGIELDLEALVAIPAMFIISWARSGPPDEPDAEADHEADD